MVGVPRSKGCTTCRKRKIACDQGKPTCQICQSRGVRCEGYAKYPVILQWTPDGLKKRRRFEEVASVSPYESVSDTSSNDGYSSEIAPAAGSSKDIVLLQQVSAAPLVLEQLEVKCLESYLPLGGSATEDLKSSWMWSMVSQPDHGRALKCSFAALCLARIGLIQKNEGLIAQAREQYGHGLLSLQYALQRPELAFQDRTLAAIRTLSIYELFALPFTSQATARKHEEGMTQWCLAAGPQSINSDFALQVFHDVRWCIMNRDIEGRKCSRLGSEEWKSLPWQSFSKDSLQCLFDIGFDLASLLERLDELNACIDTGTVEEKYSRLKYGCTAARWAMEGWYSINWTAPAKQIYAQDACDDRREEDERPALQQRLESFWQATNMAYYWLFTMILNELMLGLLAKLPRQTQFSPFELSGFSSEQAAATNVRLATNIVLASPHFLAEDTGWLGPQRYFFPLRKAMEHLGKARSPFYAQAKEALMSTVGRLRAC